ncbi:hypothetical protein FHG87_019576 [Trinorchestia longiramus]|nr:hypothetical protein FHG87_019576 [Trinorchestia longiramus]
MRLSQPRHVQDSLSHCTCRTACLTARAGQPASLHVQDSLPHCTCRTACLTTRAGQPAWTAQRASEALKAASNMALPGPPTGPMLAHPTGPMLAHPTGPMLAHPTGPMLAQPTGPGLVHNQNTGPKPMTSMSSDGCRPPITSHEQSDGQSLRNMYQMNTGTQECTVQLHHTSQPTFTGFQAKPNTGRMHNTGREGNPSPHAPVHLTSVPSLTCPSTASSSSTRVPASGRSVTPPGRSSCEDRERRRRKRRAASDSESGRRSGRPQRSGSLDRSGTRYEKSGRPESKSDFESSRKTGSHSESGRRSGGHSESGRRSGRYEKSGSRSSVRGTSSEDNLPTNFRSAVAEFAPPLPPALLRKLQIKEVNGLGKSSQSKKRVMVWAVRSLSGLEMWTPQRCCNCHDVNTFVAMRPTGGSLSTTTTTTGNRIQPPPHLATEVQPTSLPQLVTEVQPPPQLATEVQPPPPPQLATEVQPTSLPQLVTEVQPPPQLATELQPPPHLATEVQPPPQLATEVQPPPQLATELQPPPPQLATGLQPSPQPASVAERKAEVPRHRLLRC